VLRATVADARALRELYMQDYVDCHRRVHPGAAGAARAEAWETVLGAVDFEALLEEVEGTRKSGGSHGSVRLLKCVATATSGAEAHCIVGYVLYELREKGPSRRRQRYCELVNIVVRANWRGCGAGRRLFEALCEDLACTAPAQAGDLRLYVAERNVGPLAWYRRLGFQNAGWQSELVGDTTVRFLRMARRSSS